MANYCWAARTLPLLVVAAALIAACTSGGDSPNRETFDAGLAESYDPGTVTTFVDTIEVARASFAEQPPRPTLEGDLVFHLIRFESGEFLAINANAAHSGCQVYWSLDAPPTESAADTGWFREPCHGAVYDSLGQHVFGPGAHGLDRHPTELRDGRLYIDLAETARIPGGRNRVPGHADTTPTPARTPTATIATPTPPPANTWSAADLLAALASRGINVQPTGHTIACTEVNGLPGTEYAGDANFILWVYDSAAAATAEWSVADYQAQHPVLDCNRAPARIYPRDNLILWVRADPPSTDNAFDPAIEVANTFLALDNRPLVPHLHGFPVDPPAIGVPYSTVDLIEAAANEGLTLVPHADALCRDEDSAAERHHLVHGPAGSLTLDVTVVLLVYPSAAALESEWRVGSDGPLGRPGSHRQREPDCVGAARTIHISANLALLTQRPLRPESANFEAALLRAFTSLTSGSAPTATTTPSPTPAPTATATPAVSAPTIGSRGAPPTSSPRSKRRRSESSRPVAPAACAEVNDHQTPSPYPRGGGVL